MNSLSLIAALLAAAVLGTSFRTTRHIGVAAAAGLCFLHPWLAPIVVIAVAGIFLRRGR